RSWGGTRASATPPKEVHHGRTANRADIPVRGRAGARRLLVVPLRPVEAPAVLRRLAQDHRVQAGEVQHERAAEDLAVRLQAEREPAVLRRLTQEADG